ncbi:MAG: DUF6273 domain-containing protein [Firmicutes bacterium]|nr:DUF6273 domain-containing protein [Bacillota bacterium]
MKKSSRKRAAVVGGIALAAAAAIAALAVFVAVPMVKFSKADSLEDKGDTAGAYDALDRLDERWDAVKYRAAQARKDALQARVIASRSAQTLRFGGREWLVLEERDGKALLLLKDILEMRPYNEALTDTSWESCTLRLYLNGSFYKSFGEADRARIAETAVINSESADYGTAGGSGTKDHIFLLSLAQAKLYFPGDDARVARENGAARYWWLRSPGLEPILAATVGSDGALGYAGTGVDYTNRGVRPAMWVTME